MMMIIIIIIIVIVIIIVVVVFIKVSSSELDSLVWQFSKTRNISCKDVYSHFFYSLVVSGWKKVLWKQFISLSKSIFSWRLFQQLIPMDFALVRRGICLVSWCHLCEAVVEDLNHIFLQCFYANAVWDFIGSSFDTKMFTLGTIL